MDEATQFAAKYRSAPISIFLSAFALERTGIRIYRI
jgi:hypothetical protein